MKIEFVMPEVVVKNYMITLTPNEYSDLRWVLEQIAESYPHTVRPSLVESAKRFIREFDRAPTQA